MIVDSRITAVTVFTDRAEITRTVSERLEAGEHSLIFDMLPESIEQSSVQVKGGGDAVLRGVQFRRVNFEEHPDVDIKELIDKKISLEDSVGVLNDRISGAEKERGFVEDISKRLTVATEQSSDFEFDPEKWIRMVEFYRSRIDHLGAEIRSLTKERSLLEKSFNKVLSDISLKGDRGRRAVNNAPSGLYRPAPASDTILKHNFQGKLSLLNEEIFFCKNQRDCPMCRSLNLIIQFYIQLP